MHNAQAGPLQQQAAIQWLSQALPVRRIETAAAEAERPCRDSGAGRTVPGFDEIPDQDSQSNKVLTLRIIHGTAFPPLPIYPHRSFRRLLTVAGGRISREWPDGAPGIHRMHDKPPTSEPGTGLLSGTKNPDHTLPKLWLIQGGVKIPKSPYS
ncbi:MAG: hypothetical protein Q7J42_07735 [Sulfuritalea sp.]|nr:hypothetical protein [Sulfuritalea sp.]